MSRYYGGDDYDAYDHMTNDPVDFATHGYGGFGYDTSHVPKDEPRSELTKAAMAGEFAEVKSIVEAAKAVSDEEKNSVINHARRWTEVDYKMSGFTKEYEWFDITPLAYAAVAGFDNIVQYLLEEWADPTLSGCPTEDQSSDAFKAASIGAQHGKGGKRCAALLEAVKPFWKEAKYAGVRYNKKSRQKFANAPTDFEGMLDALGAV